jgi:lyso-ornithine lipid O-acyltransferase
VRAKAAATGGRAGRIHDLSLGSPIRATLRLLAYFLFTLFAVPVQAVLLKTSRTGRERFPQWYHRQCCRILSFQVRVIGQVSPVRPTLFVCNHTSYLDITVLGSLVPGSFVAKSEVARWPFFGALAKLQRTIFVDRRRHTTHTQRDELRRRLDEGGHVVLFPEGTSNDGNRTLPFRSALFSVAEPRQQAGEAGPVAELTVQPVSIAYVRLNGLPIGHGLRPLFAWYGDMDLFAHLVSLAGLGALTVRVEFHSPVPFSRFGSRKALSEHCHRAVAEGVDRAIRGK